MNTSALSTYIQERPRFWACVAAVSCGALYGVPALYPKLYLLGWIAFVPFLLGLQHCRSIRQAYAFGLLAGFVAYGVCTNWMAEFVRIFRGYSVAHSVGLASLYWLYCAQIFALIAVLTHFARRRNAVLWVFPTTLAFVLTFFPTLFPWQFGDSQSEFLVAIQGADITGVSGLDFILGIVAVLIAQALIGRQEFFQRGVLAAYALVAVWFVYGVVSLSHWESATAEWDTLKVGLVQPNEPPMIGTPGPRPGFSLGYPLEMNLTEQLVAAGAELVIWPELRDTRYYAAPFVQTAFQRQVTNLKIPLLLQAPEQDAGRLYFNTSVLIDGTGTERGKYRKVKRIAMAEYLPLFDHSDAVKDWTRRNLGAFFGDYSAGSEPKSLDIGKASIQPFICYEVMFTRFVAETTHVTRGDILVAQSNNGWFGNTRVPYPHMGASVLRSVENRRPFMHVMNNGLGGVVLPSGRTVLRTAHGEVAGYLLDIPYRKNSAATFYSRFPYWFVSLLGLGLLVMLVRAKRRD